jgi:zinc protease
VLEKYLQDFPAGNLDPLVMPQKTHWWQAKRIEERKAVNLVYFLIGFPSVDILSDDLYALDLLAEILGGGSSSYLDKKLRVEKGLVFSIDASNRTPLYPGVLMISANLDIKKYDVFVPELLRELEAVKNGALSEEDLDKAKKQFLAGYFASRQTVGGVAADLVSGKLYTGEADFNQRYIEEIKKVGLKQIKQAARKYIDLQKLLLVSFLPQAAQKGQRAQAPDLTSLNQEPEKVSVSESLTAVVKEDHRLPLVNIHAVFLGGLRAEDEKTNGLTNFMSRMLIKGTKRRSGIEIEEALEKVGGAINAYCGQNSFGISINVMRDDLDLALDILYDILFNSLFPPAQIEKVRERILAEINAQDDDIFSTAGKLLKSELYRVHPYGMPLEGRQETVGKFSRRDLIAFYQRYVRANKMVISVFGDVQKKQVFPKIKRKFIRLAKTKPLPIQTRPEPKLDSLRSKTKQLPNKEQLLLMWGFPAVDLKSPDRYAMDVLKVILGGQSSRMFQEIREKQGLAYTLGAFQSLGIDPGYLGLYVSTSLGKLTLVEDELAKQIKRLREELVSDTELNDCKSYLKGQYILHLQDTSAFGERVALDELYGLGYADYKNEVGRIEAVTKEDIQRVSRLYLDLAAFAQAVVEPSKKDAPEKNKNQSSLEKNILKR